ncbi:hypothetical protein GCM10010378_30490 [Streptomyces viridochromogenes]
MLVVASWPTVKTKTRSEYSSSGATLRAEANADRSDRLGEGRRLRMHGGFVERFPASGMAQGPGHCQELKTGGRDVGVASEHAPRPPSTSSATSPPPSRSTTHPSGQDTLDSEHVRGAQERSRESVLSPSV